MKGKKLNELFKKSYVKAGSIVLAAALVFGGSMWALDSRTDVPELVTFVDSEGSIEIAEEDTPLAAPKVTKSVKTQKKKKKIKLKKASKKTYTKKGNLKTEKSTTESTVGDTTTTVETIVDTLITDQYKKGSKTDTQTTTITTTTITTVVEGEEEAVAVTSANPSLAQIAPKVDNRVANAFESLGFTVQIDSSVSYSGLFDARTRSITLKKADATVYHELGHFVAFIAGNVDMSAEFQSVFAAEKSRYTAYNKNYVLKDSSEYFAESFKNYTENPGALKAERPNTYAAIEAALSRITAAQVTKVNNVYGAVWRG